MYKKDSLKEYIQNSSLRIFKNTIYVRLSEDLVQNYDNWLYDIYLNSMYDYYNQLLSLDLKFPYNTHPNLYIYIVPLENYWELLSYPKNYYKWTGGWRPVNCYDLDWYRCAFGTTQNLCINYPENPSISEIVKKIHELAHIICNQITQKSTSFSEGLAETVPLYILDYEKSFIEHRDAILSLKQEEIFTVSELFSSERNNSFWTTSVYPNKTCSFRYSYISSYLFIRWLLETITELKGLSKIWALQYFLDFLKNSTYWHEWLVWEICNDLWLNSDEILNWKFLQNKVILSIKKDS